jgi:DNA primase
MATAVIEQIKNRLPITDVLASYITLIPAGGQFKAKCPFHNERTASFSVSPDRGLYYCFGCGAKGDMFTFVEQFEGTDFKGALKILADRAGVPLTDDYEKRDDTDPLYEILEKAAVRYESTLAQHPEVLAYLSSRGITNETIAAFRIGYAPDEWRFIASSLGEGDARAAERAGLIKKTDKGYYDRFRSRIMFPLADSSGRIVGFSGRLFPDKEGEPKYLNSPETEVFQKSRVLFGFDKAKFAIRKNNFAILVEGQFDLIMSHQAGFKNTVATSGTAVSDQSAQDPTAQLTVLSRLTPNLFLAFDGDSAGEKALTRAALVALSLGLNPKVVPLTGKDDPADFLAAHGAQAWKDLLKTSQHFIMHEVSLVRRDAQSPHAFARLIKERVFPYLSRVVSPIEQKFYIEAIAKEIGMSSDAVIGELSLYTKPQMPATPAAPESTEQPLTLAERFSALLEKYPDEGLEKYRHMLETLSHDNTPYVLPVLSMEQKNRALTLIERDYGSLNTERRNALAAELAQKITSQFFDEIRAGYTRTLITAEANNEEQLAEATLIKLQELNKRRHESS